MFEQFILLTDHLVMLL